MVAYIVNFTDPEVTPFNVNSFTTDGPVAPNTLQLSASAVKASTSLVLYGKGHPQYGERIQENLVNLLENFSGSTQPTFPTSGQTWFARITYVLIDGVGSPGSAAIYRWVDDSSISAGGSWTLLTNTASSDPTVADEIKTIGAQPVTIVNGSFWLDTVGSPTIPELYLAVNDSTSNLSASFLKREMENLTGLVTAGELTSGEYTPQKQLKVYDGVEWKNSGNVFTSKAPPQNPSIGDLWYHLDIVGSPPAGSPTLGGGGGPLSQLFIWARPGPGKTPRWLTTGYVDRSGDVMTGTLSFGLPTSSLFLWEGGGNDLTGPDIRMTGNGLLTSADNFYIHIDDDFSDASAGNNVFEIATGSQTRGSPQRPLFQVQNDGVVRSALPLGSPEGSIYETLILASDKNALVNRRYVDANTGSVTLNTANIALNAAHIAILQGGGSPFQAKVNRSGDTMTGQLTIIIGGSPQIGSIGLDMSDLLINNLQIPQAPEQAANKFYVDQEIATLFGSPTPTGFNDGVVDTITVDWVGSQQITLTRTESLPNLTGSLVHNHDASTIIQTVTTPYLRDLFQETSFGSPLFNAPGSPTGSPNTPEFPTPLDVLISEVNDTALEDLNSRSATLESPTDRELFVVGVGSPLASGGSPVLNNTSFSLTEETFVAGTNRLHVYVNGVKQYANERAYQKISFNTGLGLSPSARTELANDGTVYTLDIAVDGGGEIVMSAPGNTLQLYQDIIDEINLQISSVTAVWSVRDTAIVVYSNTTGTGSEINIADGGGSPLTSILLALSLVGLGSPAVAPYTVGNISPIAGGKVSAIIQDLAYREVVDYVASTVDAEYGQVSASVIFNAQLNPGDVVELLANPAFYGG